MLMSFQNRESVCEQLHEHVSVFMEWLWRLWENLCENQKHHLRSVVLSFFCSFTLFYQLLCYPRVLYAVPWCLACFSEYVMQHWKEDFMFGYQFLNGCNPVVIRKCTKLPDNFPVTNEMVSVSLERDLTLEQEIKVDIFFLWIFLTSLSI